MAKRYFKIEDGIKKYYTPKQIVGETVQSIIGGVLFFSIFLIGGFALAGIILGG